MQARRFQRSSSLLAIVPTVLACSSSSGSGSSVGNAQASSDAAAALCARYEACAPALLELIWGDTMTCATRLAAQVEATLASTGTSDTASGFEACAQALPGDSCDQLLGRNIPAPCLAVPGSLASGAACGDDSQCTGGHCNVPSGQTCGVCSTYAKAGASCTSDNDCDHGLACAGGSCVAYVTMGGACSATKPCVPTLVCKSGSCATPGAAGASCSATGPDTCDNLHGVFCSGQTCKAIGFAASGATCGLVSGTLTLCESDGVSEVGAACKGFGGTATKPTGTCQAPAADGSSCNATTGPFCVQPSVCVNGSCKLNDPSSCH